MSDEDRRWMRMSRFTSEWQTGFKNYVQSIFEGTSKEETAPCPCTRCRCMSYRNEKEVRTHVAMRGFDESFIREGNGQPSLFDEQDNANEGARGHADGSHDLVSSLISGVIHGEVIGNDEEEPNETAKKLYRLLEEAKKELYPGCKEVTKVSFIVMLFQIKCMDGLSNGCLERILRLFLLVLPDGHCLPTSLDKLRKVVRDLGLDYQKIHACVNDCVLFRGDYADMDNCPTCGESRWKESGGTEKDDSDLTACGQKYFPRKILRYFPLIPRLQRLYMRASTSSLMRWHKEELVHDGKMRHPADSLAWQHVDGEYKDFASDPRNIRLGLAADGFNPFGMLNVAYTTWPVILIPYNLPPWLCLKQPYWMMSMLIPGPKSPGMNIDVYLQPLIDELKELWLKGVKTWDAKEKKNFTLHALLLWTINDFPAYAMLSGWSTKGKFACPYCHKDTDYLWLKFGSKHCYLGHRRFLPQNHRWRRNKNSFNNKIEMREAPVPLTGAQVIQQHESFEQPKFGTATRKRKQREEESRWHNWRKKSIFFELPYWKKLLVRHNLDVMHIEKNICESIIGTLLGIDGKCKDSDKARLDMQHLGIRQDQHPVLQNGQYTLPPSLYSLGKDEKIMLCKFLEGVRMPDGYASNIKRCVDVKGCKVSGLKSHDYHVILQKLLPLVARHILPGDVARPLIQLSRFFNALCSKELVQSDIEKLSSSIAETLCQLEMIFPPALFDIMMHLPVHLPEETKVGGPVCYRWMYPIERYLRTLKGYVRNKAHPEGSIAEGYISEECMTFCSRFLEDIETKLDRPARHERSAVNEPPAGLSIFGSIDYSKKGCKVEHISRSDMLRMRHYILSNYDEAIPWINEHKELLRRTSAHGVDKRHREQFVGWFERKMKVVYAERKISGELYALSQGPHYLARVFSRCFIHDFLFRTTSIEATFSTQNSGVLVKGDDSTGNMDWYGVLKKIITLDFPGEKEVILFECDWFDVPAATKNKSRGYSKDQYGIIDIDTTQRRYVNDPYVLGTQVEQVFYVKCANKSNWSSVVRLKPRTLFSMPESEETERQGQIDIDSLDVGVETMNICSQHEELKNWTRNDLQGVTGEASIIEKAIPVPEPNDEDLVDEDDDNDDTYINDGHVAPVNSLGQGQDDEFFT